MDMSPAVLGYLFGLFAVGVVAFTVGLRLGVRTTVKPPPSEDEQVAAAFGVLRRHFERCALAELESTGAPIWSPDPARVADLSYGLERDVPALVGRNGAARRAPGER
ncbi:hypothetical protein LJR164_003020 [Phenylobacterium sp. LjRoot164]|uniref:hypothetical protein n=1 Tax=unclassified Phenylobacterium TaxID=2640670 RepID=UPI003ECDD7CD